MKRSVLVICMLLTAVLCKPQKPAQGNFEDMISNVFTPGNKPQQQPETSLPTNPLKDKNNKVLSKDAITSSALTEPNATPASTLQGCGYRNTDDIDFKFPRDNENQSQFAEFPWMVAILHEEKYQDETLNVYKCGGSLIHPSVVLTAAHCVSQKPANTLKIRAGEWDTQTKDELYPDQDRNIIDVVTHENFNISGLHNDIALLFLDTPVKLSHNVKMVCLPPKDTNFDGARCFATGWGKDIYGQAGRYQVILKKIDLPIVRNDECQASLRTTSLGIYFELHQSSLCAGAVKGKGTCEGDDGSPLVCPIPGTKDRFYQAGIVSSRIRCGDGIPDVFASIPTLRVWIDEQLKNKKIDTAFFTP